MSAAPAAPPERDPREAPGPTLSEMAEKADAYANDLVSVEGLKGVLRIIAQNIRDATTRGGGR